MKQVSLGTEDFKEIIQNNGYYVDKTKSIELIEQFNTNRKIILFHVLDVLVKLYFSLP